MSTERRSLIGFLLIAAVVVVGAIWIGNWLASGGPTLSVAKPGQIVFINDRTGTPELWIMNEDGSGAHRLMAQTGDKQETAFSPQGDWIYYTDQFEGSEQYQLGRVRPSGRSSGRLLGMAGNESSLSVSRGRGRIGYVSNSQVFTCDLDGRNPEKVLPSQMDGTLGPGQLAGVGEDVPPLRRYTSAILSPTKGWVAAISQGYDNERAYISLGQDAVTTTLLDPAQHPILTEECSMGWSPDGTKLAVATVGPPGPSFLAVYTPGSNTVRVQSVPFEMPSLVILNNRSATVGYRHPAWSADSRKIAFEEIKYNKDGSRTSNGIWIADASGSIPKQVVKGDAILPSFSPDGRFMLYQAGADLARYDLRTGEHKNLTHGKGLSRYASWSPVLPKNKK